MAWNEQMRRANGTNAPRKVNLHKNTVEVKAALFTKDGAVPQTINDKSEWILKS